VLNANPSFLPVICVCASKQIGGDAGRHVGGFSYIQGSGDDHELWSMVYLCNRFRCATNEFLKKGLTPRIFWKYRTELIASPRAKLEELIKDILSSSQAECSTSSTTANLPEPVLSPIPIHRVNGKIQLASFSPPDLNALLSSLQSEIIAGVAHVVLDSSRSSTCAGSCIMGPTQNILHIFSPSKSKAKPDAHFLQYVLPTAIPFVKANLFRESPKLIYILEGCGNHSEISLDMSIGLAVVAIQLFFDKMGTLMQIDKTQGQIQLLKRNSIVFRCCFCS